MDIPYPLPHSLNAEKSVLGAMMLSREAVSAALAELEPDDFYFQSNGTIFAEMKALSQKQRAVDFVTLTDALEAKHALDPVGGYDYLMQLSTFVPSPARIGEYVKIVKDKALLRKTAAVCKETATKIEAEEPEPQEVVADLSSRLAAITQRASGNRHMVTHADAMDIGQAILDAQNDSTKTRIPSLDRATGGLQQGTLTVLAARPGMGKSALYQTIARNILLAEGTVVIYSLEMTRKQVYARFASMESKVPLKRVEKKVEPTPEEVDKAMRAFADIQEGWQGLFFDDNPYTSPDYIRATLGMVQQKRAVDLVVVDYLQLMSLPGISSDKRYQTVTELSRRMKLTAMEFDIPLLLLSQLNRRSEERENKMPILADLRESGAIEQDADMVWFIHREGEYDITKPQDEALLKIAKNRQGETGTIALHWDGAHTLFTEQSPRVPPTQTRMGG